MDKKEALKELAEIDRVEAEQAARRAALRAIIEAPEKPQGRRGWKEGDLRAGLRFKNDRGQLRELQKPNGNPMAYGPGWSYGPGTGNWDQSTYIVKCLNNRDLNPNLDPDIHGANPSEDARLWLESFVPCYGLTVPDMETLREGYWLDYAGTVKRIRDLYNNGELSSIYYLDGTWHPTREAAEAWLERFGKVRGFRK